MNKILFYIEKLAYQGSIGGAEKVLLTLVNNMDPRQFDITVQTLYPDEYARLLAPHIHYKYCYPHKNRLTSLLYRAEAEAGLTYPLHIKGDYDIEAAFLEYDSTKVIAASTNRRAKKVAWIHCDLNAAVRDKERFVSKTKAIYGKYDKIVCVSEKCEESFHSLFGRDDRTLVIHNVIDEDEIRNRSKLPLPEKVCSDRLILCCVGSFSPPKNHFRLLMACKRLHDEGREFELWLVGDGVLRQEIEEFISKNEMGEYVRLWGFQTNPYPFMNQADLLVCSSSYEGFSTFITEGVILGKRILTTDCSGMHEILDGYSGGMIVPNDDEAFYSGLLDCMTKPLSAEPAGGAGFSKEALVRANEDFFKALLRNSGE